MIINITQSTSFLSSWSLWKKSFPPFWEVGKRGKKVGQLPFMSFFPFGLFFAALVRFFPPFRKESGKKIRLLLENRRENCKCVAHDSPVICRIIETFDFFAGKNRTLTPPWTNWKKICVLAEIKVTWTGMPGVHSRIEKKKFLVQTHNLWSD